MGLFSWKKKTDQFAIPAPPTLQAPSPAPAQGTGSDLTPWDKNLTISRTAINELGVGAPSRPVSGDVSGWDAKPPQFNPDGGNNTLPNTVFSGSAPDSFDSMRRSSRPAPSIPLPPTLEPTALSRPPPPSPRQIAPQSFQQNTHQSNPQTAPPTLSPMPKMPPPSQQQNTAQQRQVLPALELHEPEKKENPIEAHKEGEEFALPDFDDDELKRLEDIERMREQQAQQALVARQQAEAQVRLRAQQLQQEEQMRQSMQLQQPTSTPSPDNGSWTSDPQEDNNYNPSPQNDSDEEPEMPDYTQQEEEEEAPEVPQVPATLPPIDPNQPKFIALKDFFDLRDGLTGSKLSARNAEEEMFEQTYKRKTEIYKSAFSTFSTIQDNLMKIDARMFDTSDGPTPEVRK